MDKLTIQEFGATIKQKYPQYSTLSDYEIGEKTIAKYPQYNEKVVKTFDVPEVTKQKPNLLQLQQEAQQAQKEAKKANSIGGFLGNFGKALVENIAPSEVGLGKTIGKLAGNQTKTYSKLINDVSNQQVTLLKAIKEKENNGGDTTSLKRIYNDNVNQLRELNKSLAEEGNLPSTGKVLGQLGGTALDVLSAGTYSKAKTALMGSGKLAPSASKLTEKLATATGVPELGKIAGQKAGGLFTKQGVKNVATGAGLGYANDVTMGLQGLRGEDREGVKSLIPGLGTAIGTTIPLVSEATQTVKNIKNPSPERVNNAINELESKYTEWSSGTKPGKKLVNQFGKKTEALNKAGTTGREPQRVLAEKGIVPQLNGVKFDTFQQADDFRNSASSLREANKLALQEAQLSTVPTDITVLEAKALKEAKTPQNINSGRFDKMEKDIRREFAILRKNYPDGKIPLGLQDDIKSARWDNVFKNKGLVEADVLKKDSEYAIAKAFQKNIEEVAEQAGAKDVAQLNREIGDIMDASKFLESLDGKVLKGGRLGKFVGTVIGSSLGQTIPGKIVGAVGGNIVADQLIKADVQSPVRRAILKRLKEQDPEAYQMTLKWLTEQDTLRGNRLALPAGGIQPIINEGRPIKVFPKNVEGEYVGKDIVGQSKSPTAQQTNPAMTKVNNTVIPKSSPKSATKSIDPLINEAKKYKSAEEFVKAQPKVYRGEGGSNVAQGKALLAEGKHFASDAEYPKGFGKVGEYVLKPNAKVLDLGDSTFAEISQKLGIPERKYISPKELSAIAKEKGYDVVKYTGEYKSTGKQFSHTVDLTGDSYITKSQLEEIWKKANPNKTVSKLIKKNGRVELNGRSMSLDQVKGMTDKEIIKLLEDIPF